MIETVWSEDPYSPICRWLCERIGLEPTRHFRAIARISPESIIGAVGYDGFNGASCMMHSAGKDGHWLTREFLHLIFHYPFDVCDLKCVLALVPSGNVRALKLDQHVGFHIVTELKDAHPDGSMFLLRMNKEDCKWVRKPPPLRLQQAA